MLAIAERLDILCVNNARNLMNIRELTISDYDPMVEIWRQAGLPYRPLGRDACERFCLEIQEDTAVFLGAEVDGELVGVVLGTHDGRKGWINRLAVLPAFRGRGFARALVLEVERRLNDRGILIVTCLIEADNGPSETLFQSLGYLGHGDITYYSKRQSQDW